MAFFFFFTINARTISCSVLITGAFPLINGVNIHELFNTIEIKRPVRHFPIYDFFIQFRTRAYNCKMKKNPLFSFAVFVNSDMRRKMNIIGFDFFSF